MLSSRDVAAIRLDNALILFDEFVRSTVKNADAATLRGLERRFAERLAIQPSYWSQIKSRSRQIGERLARQFELHCHKPAGWMDLDHGAPSAPSGMAPGAGADSASGELTPQDDDERFIIGLVLTYYRRHPQRARTRLLDLLGEVLVPTPPAAPPAAPLAPNPGPTKATRPGAKAGSAAPPADDPLALWRQAQSGIAPLKNTKR